MKKTKDLVGEVIKREDVQGMVEATDNLLSVHFMCPTCKQELILEVARVDAVKMSKSEMKILKRVR